MYTWEPWPGREFEFPAAIEDGGGADVEAAVVEADAAAGVPADVEADGAVSE